MLIYCMTKNRLENYFIYLDVEKCSGCKRCMIACAVAHSSSKNIYAAIYEVPPPLPRVYVQSAQGYTVPILCRHCEKAPCAAVCPVSALERVEGGVVRLKEDVCIGCKACVIACPFGAISLDYQRKVMLKCDLCLDRLVRRGH